MFDLIEAFLEARVVLRVGDEAVYAAERPFSVEELPEALFWCFAVDACVGAVFRGGGGYSQGVQYALQADETYALCSLINDSEAGSK